MVERQLPTIIVHARCTLNKRHSGFEPVEPLLGTIRPQNPKVESVFNGQKKGDLAKINPYLVAAGTELDDLVSLALDEQAGLGRSNPYSTETSSADVLLKELRLRYKVKIIIGKTTIHQKPWFARFGTDPSTSTEVVAETYPLALSRLSLLLAIQRDT